MESFVNIIIFLVGFIIISIAANQISKQFVKFRLPLITGLIVVGILAGPYVLGLISKEAISKLNFVNELALAFIAYAAGSELYLNEMRSRFKSIRIMTIAQFVVTFVLGTAAILMMSEFIPFVKDISIYGKVVIAMLTSTIFIVPSPPSVIAVINEIRAKGPFTQTVLGVTVLKEFLVVILFSVIFSVAKAIINGSSFNFYLFFLLLAELITAFVIGYLLSKFLQFVLFLKTSITFKAVLVVLSGYAIYVLSHFIQDVSKPLLESELYIEPLLICIIASFIITNNQKYRSEFLKIINDSGPGIYAVFFTLIGASMVMDVLYDYILIIIFLFSLRVVTLIIGCYFGGVASGDPPRFNIVSWMPYVPQAGVGLGLASIVGTQFPGWGEQFSTVMFGTIIISLLIGPPLLKWAINHVDEAHAKAPAHEFDGIRDAIIFGFEDQSLALARQLQSHGWNVKIATRSRDFRGIEPDISGIQIQYIEDLTEDSLEQLETGKAEAIVSMLEDGENYKVCELVYEKYGSNMVVRLNDRANFDQFHELGCLIVEPSTAIVSLMDHLVRSPQGASLLLGIDEDQDTIDLEVLNPDLHGISLRDLRLPRDIIILSTKRGGQTIISTGYTRLRLHDIITVVGSVESLENVKLKFEG